MRKLLSKFLCRLNIHPWHGLVSEEGWFCVFCKYCVKILDDDEQEFQYKHKD